MKNFAAIVMILIVTVIGFETSYAQDFTIWEGKWFRITERISGLQGNESQTISSFRESRTTD